ncbi:MAG: type II CAAX endopeptidase family protein [Sphingomicrobium sp.]
MATIEAEAAPGPLWKRITDFPLVAMLIALAAFIGTSALASVIGKALPPMDPLLATATRATITLLLMLATYKLIIRRLGEEPRDDLPLAGSAKGVSVGAGFGFLLFSLIVGIAALFDVYNIVGPGGTDQVIPSLIAIAILPGFMEELLFRGILFHFLEKFGGSWFALAMTSALFGLAHIFNDNATALSSFAIAIEAGVLLGGAYMLTRSLWMPIGLHASWNFTQGEIYDVPVSGFDQHGLVTAQLSGPELLSGGAFGLEASVIAMIIATAAGVWLVLRAVRSGYTLRPWWVRRRLARQAALDLGQVTGPTV